MTKVALLSHRFGNIGHSFMAVGAEEVVAEAFGPDAEITHFEQHFPFEVHGKSHPMRRLDPPRLGRLVPLLRALEPEFVQRLLWRQTLPLDFDLAVACGGPNIVAGGSRALPLRMMLHYMNGAFRFRGVPLIDAAVGCCFPYERVPDELPPEDAAFYRAAMERCSVVAVRDPIAARIRSQLGFEGPLLPCIALSSGRRFEAIAGGARRKGDDGYLLVNFQRRGANEDWGQGVDPARWMSVVRDALEILRQRHDVVLVAHSAAESEAARELAPDLPCFRPESVEEYARVAAGAKVGFVSRLHAGIALAGIGVPSLVVGTDTRLGTAELIGLDTAYVKTLTAGDVVERVERLIAARAVERERLIALREATIREYAKLFRSTIRTDR
ncbi:MAG: polysaccharide pyruvyl transferase family protein [Rhodospirillales bacterium]|nr:polysaccharide pyruvyl transferase family protein [Rhodospirillales bacterium]